MGGLLDRATHVADQTFEPKPNPDATTIVLGEVSPPDPDGTTGTGPFVDGMFGLTGGATQGIAFGLSALFALIGMIITFRMGSIRVGSVVFLFMTLGVGLAPDLSFGRFHPRIVAVVVVALLLNAIPIPLMAGFDGTGSGVISEVSFDEDENELVFKIYAPSAVPSNRASKRTASRSGRTRSRCGGIRRPSVSMSPSSSPGTASRTTVLMMSSIASFSARIPTTSMATSSRMPTHAGVEIEQKVETTSGSANSNSQDEVVGLYISTIVGLKDPQAGGSEDGGDYANRSISTFPSDYSFTLTIVKGDRIDGHIPSSPWTAPPPVGLVVRATSASDSSPLAVIDRMISVWRTSPEMRSSTEMDAMSSMSRSHEPMSMGPNRRSSWIEPRHGRSIGRSERVVRTTTTLHLLDRI